jgi:hypothetical protein
MRREKIMTKAEMRKRDDVEVGPDHGTKKS